MVEDFSGRKDVSHLMGVLMNMKLIKVNMNLHIQSLIFLSL